MANAIYLGTELYQDARLVRKGRPSMVEQKYFCPSEVALEALSGKWKSTILWILSHGPRRFNQLQSLLEGVPKQSLSDRLRELESDGIVHRRQYQERPARFEYELTEDGKELWDVVKQLCMWGKRRSPHQTFKSELCVQALLNGAGTNQ